MPVESIFVLGAVTAFVELVNRLFKKDLEAAIKIVGAGVIGTLAGLYAVDGLTLVDGLLAGLSASGLITVVQRVATGTTPQPTLVPNTEGTDRKSVV